MGKVEVAEVVIENVEKRDIRALKSNIEVIINFDKNFSKGDVKVNLEYIKANGINLFENYDNKGLISDKPESEYTNRDFTDAIFYLKKNFCNERLADVKKIGQVLYKEKVEVKKTIRNSDSSNSNKKSYSNTQYTKSDDNSGKKNLGIAIGVGVIVIGIIIALVKS